MSQGDITNVASPSPTPENTGELAHTQTQGTSLPEQQPANAPAAPAFQTLPGFQGLRLELTDDEFANKSTAKALYRDLIRLGSELDSLRPYLPRCFEAEKQVAVLAERLQSQINLAGERAKNQGLVDLVLAAGVGLGCTMLGLSPSVTAGWTRGVCIAVGIVLFGCGVAAKWIKR